MVRQSSGLREVGGITIFSKLPWCCWLLQVGRYLVVQKCPCPSDVQLELSVNTCWTFAHKTTAWRQFVVLVLNWCCQLVTLRNRGLNWLLTLKCDWYWNSEGCKRDFEARHWDFWLSFRHKETVQGFSETRQDQDFYRVAQKERGHHLIANILKFHDRIAWKLVNFGNIICWTQSLTFCLKTIHIVQIDLSITQ